VPDGLLEMLRIPGIGPKTVRLLHGELGIDSVEALRAAAEEGRLRRVKGLSERTETNVLEAIGRIERRGTPAAHPRRRCARGGLVGASAGRPRASGASSRPARCDAGVRRSATSTCWPPSTTRPR
jgi:hypothetical protein